MLLRFLTFEDKIKTVNGATIPPGPFDQALSKIPLINLSSHHSLKDISS